MTFNWTAGILQSHPFLVGHLQLGYFKHIFYFKPAKGSLLGASTHRRQFLDQIVSNMDEVFIVLETLLKFSPLLLFQEVEVNRSIQQGLD